MGTQLTLHFRHGPMFQARKPCRLSPKQTTNRHLVKSQSNELFNIRIVTLHFVNRILTRHQAMKHIEYTIDMMKMCCLYLLIHNWIWPHKTISNSLVYWPSCIMHQGSRYIICSYQKHYTWMQGSEESALDVCFTQWIWFWSQKPQSFESFSSNIFSTSALFQTFMEGMWRGLPVTWTRSYMVSYWLMFTPLALLSSCPHNATWCISCSC
jgi:hypothetical protein